jgi:preprotein translocase subunit SecF
MQIIKYRKIFFALSAILVAGSFLAVFLFGFNFGIDFKGGTIYEVSYIYGRPDLSGTQSRLDALGLGTYMLTPSGETNYILKTRDITPDEKTAVTRALTDSAQYPASEIRFTSVGPSVGNNLKNKAEVAIAAVVICIVLFITFAFRKVSHPVASWKYGLATVIALAHDIIIPTGVFLAWIHFHGGETDLLFVTALLAILGYSVHDTIVVFDRVRENLRLNQSAQTRSKETFAETVGHSISQTFGRSINTSLTIFLTLLALYFIGGASTKDFAFVLLVGVVVGTYSSIFVASPLLVTMEKMQGKK